MPSSRILIASNTLGSAAASVTFSDIPGTYTDLGVRISPRSDASFKSRVLKVNFNNVTGTSYSCTYLHGNGSSVSSGRASNTSTIQDATVPAATATSNTFGSTEIYVPNYTAATNKPISIFSLAEDNATAADLYATAGLFSNTSAITQIEFATSGNFVSGSSFFLYGIKNS